MVITDASLVGGGGTLFQWQKLPELGACTVAEELQKTRGVYFDGTVQHNYDHSCWHLVPFGHWNWKWNSTRANYSTYERELLPGIFLLSAQGRLVGTNLLVCFCDQESTQYFLKGDPPEDPKLRSWWTYLAQLRLNIYRVPALKNELYDWLSRESFDDKISASSEQLPREGFAKMDVHLDLGMSKVAMLDSICRKGYEEEYWAVMKALADLDWAIVEGTMWSISTRGLLREEVQTYLPKSAVRGALQWRHEVKGQPSPEQWLNSFKKTFVTLVPETSLTKMIEDLYNTCQECLTSKRNRAGDRGLVGALPIPHIVNTLLYENFID